MKSSLCVLPLNSWMIYYVDDEDGREENRLPRIEPIVRRDGWYYDRKRPIESREWYEYRGQAFITYKGSGDQFLYELSLANAHVLSAREVSAYREMLRLGVPKNLRSAIQDILRKDGEIKNLRDIRLSGLRSYKRFLAFKESHGAS